jgi:eukaryotic-like serine/threonine-protein kinase
MNGLVGQCLGRYHIVEQLGEGGMATVYKAFDTRLERTVAAKVIRTDMVPPAMIPIILKRFEQEARVLAKFSHSNIVNIYDYGEHNGAPYLVMEYLPGGTLKQRTGKPLHFITAANLLLPVARALEYAHQRDVIHRDVKPANILINASGEVKLSDFGIAKVLEMEQATQLTGTGVGIGTPEYMAPEQWVGNVFEQTDQYALGVVFYELVTGRKPYTADTPAAVLLKQMNEQLPRPRQYIPGLPETVEQVLFKVLAKQPEDRYQDIKTFAQALEKLIAMEGVSEEVENAQPDFPTIVAQPGIVEAGEETLKTVQKAPLKISWFKITAGLALLVGLVALVWFASTQIDMIKLSTLTTQTANIFTISATHLALAETTETVPGLEKTPTSTIFETGISFTASPTEVKVPLPTSSPLPPLGIGSEQISEKDGMVIVYVPEGEFLMGSNPKEDPYFYGAEYPTHRVILDSFWIYKTEVTNAMYRKCIEAKACPKLAIINSATRVDYFNNSLYDDYPIVYISWFNALAYCQWAGGTLPTEAEWEKAARGIDGRLFPWGNRPPSGSFVNYCDVNCPDELRDANQNDGYSDTAPVGNYLDGASPYGALNMAGNVWEWTLDWFDPTYYEHSPLENPQGPNLGERRVVRGGSWYNPASGVRTVNRRSERPDKEMDTLGFRCVTK